MAHNLTSSRSMIYAGATPWHGLGVEIPSNGTWEQIAPIVGFYEVEERSLFAPGMTPPIPDKKALFRKDTGTYLSTVGDDYGVVQFREMAEAVVAACGQEAVFHTAGLLGKNGIRGWLLGELPNPIKVRGDKSEIRPYILATSAHTGFHNLVFKNAATRVVCQNTLGSALGEKEGFERVIRHSSRASQRLEEAVAAFHQVVSSYERFGELANMMAGAAFSSDAFQATVDDLLPLHADKDNARRSASRAKVLELQRNATGLDGIRGTAWGAFQAWTEWADHHQNYRDAEDRSAAANRLESVWLGRAAALKRDALFAICEKAEIDAAEVLAPEKAEAA